MLSIIQHARDRQASVPHDRLYALRSLVKDSAGFTLNYAESAAEVYRDFAIHEIQRTGKLDILGFAREQNHGDYPSLPSWVADWTDFSVPEPFPKTHCISLFAGDARADHPKQVLSNAVDVEEDFRRRLDGPTPENFRYTRVYNANAGINHGVTFSADGTQLGVMGLVFDRISYNLDEIKSSTEPFYRQIVPKDFPLDEPYVTGGTYLEALSHTLCADVEVGFRASRRGKSIRWPRDGNIVKALSNNVIENVLRSGADFKSAKMDAEVSDIPFTLVRWLGARRLFVTDRGFIGLGPQNAMPGDMVYVLSGAQVPFVIRSDANCKRHVGEAYIHGIMDGEAATGQEGSFRELNLS